MTTDEAVQHYGSATALGRALGITRSAVQQWGERPPIPRQYQIQVKTGGKLRADEDQVAEGSTVA